MNVEYLSKPTVSLNNLTDEELDENIRRHILDQLPDVVRAEIARQPNRHERRKQAALDRKQEKP
jgi:hypothetical protein